MTFSALIEPSILFVTFTVALMTATDLPYCEAAAVRSSLGQVIDPAHLLAAVAFFLVVLSDTGRIPGRDAHQHPRVRDDRRGARARALRPGFRAAEVGLEP